MQKQRINSNYQAGMAMIMTMFAVLALSLIATALLKSQTSMIQSQNQFLYAEAGTDATDFCVQAAVEFLKVTPPSNPTIGTTWTISPSTRISSAYAGFSITNARFSSSNAAPTSCTLQFIKSDVTNSSGSGGVEVASSRVYGSSNTVPINYYRLTSVKDDSNIRVEYQMVLAI